MKKLSLAIAVLALSVIMAGCGTIYTLRQSGPQSDSIRITKGLSKADVINTLGAPDSIYDLRGGKTAFVYHSLKYSNVLGIYAITKKKDFFLLFENDNLADQGWTSTGETMAIIGYQTLTLGMNSGD